jgi:hypothetical protein
MSRSSKDPGARPEVPSGVLFQQMDSAQEQGDYIVAGQAQRGLELRGWLIRRMEPRGRGDDLGPARSTAAAEATIEDLADEDFETDNDRGLEALDRPVGITEVLRLVGVTESELEAAIEDWRFPLPDGYILGRPFWARDTIDWWLKRASAI